MRWYWHSFLKGVHHFFVARERHGVHSPLVYQLMDKDLKIPLPSRLQRIQSHRKFLSTSNEQWEAIDFGAGSRSTTKNLGHAVRKACSDEKKGAFLYRWSHRFQPKFTLELGTHVGLGSAYLLEGCPETQLYTIEGDPFLYQKSLDWLKQYGNRVHSFNGAFDVVLKDVLPMHRWDLVVIDGHHEGEALLRYLHSILPHLNDDAWVIMDDVHWSPDMSAAWNEVVESSQSRLTLDFFQFGVYGHTARHQKEHFLLRY